MADLHELLITAELSGDLRDDELAELRWHLGLGPMPAECVIVTDGLPVVTVDDGGEPLPRDRWRVEAYPLLAQHGPADSRLGGIAYSQLARREEPHAAGWALSSRQVVHSDEFDQLTQLLVWLRERAIGYHGGPVAFSCLRRFHEDEPGSRPALVDGETW